ncbi:NRAMP family divalent metal transporter [Noviherbaspirillum galbum]|uniref:Divalent metal cation transporter n=1 Tax=Noviherbaspirillum galbum TaxID=2709383 RepID=A0A6B3SXB5_9BURK|nr:divalent metal cation transporter [Noviherbaspirillum galbum]NEX63122.1 divalent metal cation transporter [Noviherbaspirillum galbum]
MKKSDALLPESSPSRPVTAASPDHGAGSAPSTGEAQDQKWLSKLGPGLITGAADDDPSGIATYSQAGAQFGFGMLWTLLFTFPMMVGIQMVSARIGRVTGHGLAGNLCRFYPPWIMYGIVSLLLLANTINIAADLAAMGDALHLVAGGPERLYVAGFGVLSVILQIFIPYNKYVRVLKWLTLALLAYVATVFSVHIPWGQLLSGALLPRFTWESDYVTTVVALLGTTISPYLFFWQASQEVEELRASPDAVPLKDDPKQARADFSRIQIDTTIGMAFSNLVAMFIVLTTAVTLYLNGVHDIQTSAQAAQALKPVAGEFAFALFSMGIIGTGMLAIPVLAGSAAYGMAGAFRWKSSLEHEPSKAPRFYAIIAISTLSGVALGFTSIDPIKALYWSAVVNGVISVPIMVIMMLMATRVDIMGRLVIPHRLRILGWLATGVMALAVLAMFTIH